MAGALSMGRRVLDMHAGLWVVWPHCKPEILKKIKSFKVIGRLLNGVKVVKELKVSLKVCHSCWKRRKIG